MLRLVHQLPPEILVGELVSWLIQKLKNAPLMIVPALSKTGSSGYSYYEPVAQSKFVIKNSVNVPYHVSNIVRTGMLYCSGGFPDTTGVFIENSGVGVFEGGYLTTEASTQLDLSAEDKWTVQFWTKFENHHANIQNEPYSGIDVNLFGFSGKHPAESGNTFFNVGFTREITNTVTGAQTGDTDFDDVRLLLRVTGWFWVKET